jgi:tetratricopeptide (TPR) repeat protein
VRLSADSEVAVRRFRALLARSGDHAAAANVYQEFADDLATQFGIQPSAETRALVRSLSQRATPASGAIPSDVGASPPAPAPPPASETRLPARRERSHWRRWAAAAVVVFAAVFAATRMNIPRAHAEMDANRVAVLPFAVHGNPEIRYLHDGLPLLLSTRLDGTAGLQTVDTRAILLDQTRLGADTLRADGAREAAERFGARYYVIGFAVGSANTLQLDVALHDATRGGAVVARAEASGPEANLVALVDEIATKLLATRFRGDGGLVAEMAARTTSSFVALKAWLEGEAEFTAGRHTAAEQAFRAAIAADTMFAMAYYRLAVAATWSGNHDAVGPALQRAVALSHQLPPSARAIVKAFLDSRTGRYADAERAQRALLAAQPTAIDVWFDLGEVLYHANPARGRPIAESRDAFEQALRMDGKNFAAMVHLARLAASRGDTAALDSLSRHALAGEPDGTHRAELLVLRAVVLGDVPARNAFLGMPPQLITLDALWRAAEYTERLGAIDTLAATLVGRATSREMRGALFLFLAHVKTGRERFGEAERYVDSLAAYAPHYAAVTASMVALHPAVPDADRHSLVERARSRFASVRHAPTTGRIYGGTMSDDVTAPYDRVEQALLALVAGDTSRARSELARREALHATSRARLALASSASRDDGDRALRMSGDVDALYGNAYAMQTPLAPRAAFRLAHERALSRAGRTADAYARLSTVPEDLGFNVAYLAEVHRRRAALLALMGNASGSAAARDRAARIVE